eukprot:Phypoly_transcript_01639.p1 GENE.Phypoly_transcript_01639~~Phypoly_transcript_01639.p1  ORF type:complete len:968 (+),score=84.26 Phypoly_transcript_01639:164-3067(+)
MINRRSLFGELHVHQGVLENALGNLFDSRVVRNARKEVSIRHPFTGKWQEVDVWYPDLHLCFEYQDDHHYQPTWYCQLPLILLQEKDDIKRKMLLVRGETLIIIPCWWDGSQLSLQATINFHRPDLFHLVNPSCTIPENPPFSFFPEPSQLMLASFPNPLDLVDVCVQNQWWLGEKYDGVRCSWVPNKNQLYSRHGYPIHLMRSICSSFGNSCALDGELWSGRGLFIETNQLVLASEAKLDWSLFRIVCFDEPSDLMSTQIFEDRYSLLLDHFASNHPSVIAAMRFLCKSAQALAESLHMVVDEGGEGIILRKPLSLYQLGRSSDLVKLKGSRGDQEALVVDVEESGSLSLQLPDGTNFQVTKEDCVLHRRVARGDVVSFKYDFMSRHSTRERNFDDSRLLRGIPSNPVVYRIREDMLWEDIVQNSPVTVRRFVNEPHQRIDNGPQKSNEYWNYDPGNMRSLIECLARAQGFDPHIVENWYSIPSREFTKHKVVRQFIQKHHNNSWIKGLVALFPDLSLDLSKFSSAPLGFWNCVQNRRALLERFAQAKGADPLDPTFWYSMRISEFINTKGYEESVMHLFPELRLERHSFKPEKVYRSKDPDRKRLIQSTRPTYVHISRDPIIPVEAQPVRYESVEERKSFFDNFASTQGFDPLNPDNWSTVSSHSLVQSLEYKRILSFYGGKLYDCLVQLYPDIGLQHDKFNKKYRLFFDRFAASQNFDPLVPDNWYHVHIIDHLFRLQGFLSIIKYYRGKFAECLIQAYPNIALQSKILAGKLQLCKNGHRRKSKDFFDVFAAQHSFDPLEAQHWYSVSLNDFLQNKSYKAMTQHYGGNLLWCLMDVYPNIGLQKSKFTERQRLIFDNFAREQGFDPLILTNWYNISPKLFNLSQEYKSIVQFYGGELSHCLMQLYPDIGLNKSGFLKSTLQIRDRRFFDNFAKQQGFDPLVPDNWYNILQNQVFSSYSHLKFH